ncbi:MAG: efflux RND transporter periplasmic adaptor subunit, partial [Asticcacaulis sp.]
MDVKFTVDAFPDQTFTGTVHQIRLQPQSQNGVVAYDVIVYAMPTIPGEKLMPGMTANADIVVSSYTQVLKVPSAALRFTPVDPNAKTGASLSSAVNGAAGIRTGGGGGNGPGAGIARIVDQLNLSDDQKKKIQPVLDQARQDAMTRMASAGATADKGKIFHDTFTDAFTRIKPLLTPGPADEARPVAGTARRRPRHDLCPARQQAGRHSCPRRGQRRRHDHGPKPTRSRMATRSSSAAVRTPRSTPRPFRAASGVLER